MTTAIAQRLLTQMQVSPELLTEFLAVYARLEAALKNAGYADQRGTKLIIRWDDFVGRIAPHFRPSSSAEVQRAAQYLSNRPPKRETVIDGRLDWVAVAATPTTALSALVEHVHRARNNLFHGGKFRTNPEDPVRNRDVIESALIVLVAVLDLAAEHDPNVYSAFTQPLD
jgi:hypothetical protein